MSDACRKMYANRCCGNLALQSLWHAEYFVHTEGAEMYLKSRVCIVQCKDHSVTDNLTLHSKATKKVLKPAKANSTVSACECRLTYLCQLHVCQACTCLIQPCIQYDACTCFRCVPPGRHDCSFPIKIKCTLKYGHGHAHKTAATKRPCPWK